MTAHSQLRFARRKRRLASPAPLPHKDVFVALHPSRSVREKPVAPVAGVALAVVRPAGTDFLRHLAAPGPGPGRGARLCRGHGPGGAPGLAQYRSRHGPADDQCGVWPGFQPGPGPAGVLGHRGSLRQHRCRAGSGQPSGTSPGPGAAPGHSRQRLGRRRTAADPGRPADPGVQPRRDCHGRPHLLRLPVPGRRTAARTGFVGAVLQRWALFRRPAAFAPTVGPGDPRPLVAPAVPQRPRRVLGAGRLRRRPPERAAQPPGE